MNYNFIYEMNKMVKIDNIVYIAFFNTLGFLCYYTYTKYKKDQIFVQCDTCDTSDTSDTSDTNKKDVNNVNIKLELRNLLDKLTNIENNIIVLSDKLEEISEKK